MTTNGHLNKSYSDALLFIIYLAFLHHPKLASFGTSQGWLL